jgi:serine/threonine-protein kinase
MPTTGLCSRCQFPLTDLPADGVCPACGSRLPADTAQEESTPASAAAAPVGPSAELARTASFDWVEVPTRASGDHDSASSHPAPILPNYEELTAIGVGGMGVVYRAVQRTTERVVAIKFLHGAGAFDPGLRIRFDTEARALARVRHPHIVQVYEVGVADGLAYFSMEFIPGGTLARRLRAEPFTARESARIVAGVAAAVEAVHREQVLHRDIKPGNILLDVDGLPKITDFGLAKLADRDDGLTMSGNILGTPSYMAPEQAAGRVKEIDARTDVYGLGATLYELLCGQPPFKGESHAVTLQLVQSAEVVPPSRIRAGVPAELEAICLKCLEKSSAKRYATAQELADDLHRWLAGESTHARPLTRRQKARRWLRRNRAKLAVGVLLAGSVLTAGALAVQPTPRERIEHGLAAGQNMSVVDERGPPRWYDWHLGETKLAESLVGDGTAGFQTHDLSALVLVRDPSTDAYRLKADLRHVKGQAEDSAVGLFVGLETVTARPGASVTQWMGFQYSDYWWPAELKNPKLKPLHSLDAFHFLTVRTPDSISLPKVDRGAFRFTPINRADNDWRTLILHVTPAGVEVDWLSPDGTPAPAFRLSARKLEDSLRIHDTFHADKLAGFRLPMRPWNPRGAIGIYARNAAVAFRNVTIWPDPSPI